MNNAIGYGKLCHGTPGERIETVRAKRTIRVCKQCGAEPSIVKSEIGIWSENIYSIVVRCDCGDLFYECNASIVDLAERIGARINEMLLDNARRYLKFETEDSQERIPERAVERHLENVTRGGFTPQIETGE